MSDYESWLVSRLKEECSKRGLLKDRKGYIKKPELVEILTADDDKSKSPVDTRPHAFGWKRPSPVTVRKEKPTKITNLVIGLSSHDISISSSRTHFTGGTSETLKWAELTVQKIIPRETFSLLIVWDPKVFFNVSGDFNHRRFLTVVDTLRRDDGEIYLRSCSDETSIKLHGQVEGFGYNFTGNSCSMGVHGNKYVFNIYRLGASKAGSPVWGPRDAANAILKHMRTGNGSAAAVSDETFNEDLGDPLELSPEHKQRKYSLIDVDLNVWKKTQLPDNYTPDIPYTSITLEEFRQEIDRDEFVKEFAESARNLFKYKTKFYQTKLAETRKEFEKVHQKVEKLLKNGLKADTVKEIYPMHDFYAGFIIELEDLIKIVIGRYRDTNGKEIRKNLIEAIEDPVLGFASIVGRQDIKDDIVSHLYAFSKSYKTFTNCFNNMCLMGPAGVGKTALAKVIAFVFSKSGILAKDIVRVVTKTDLVAMYIGQTAPRTRGILFETLEGVLFIDEAYQLTMEDSPRDFGSESITEIVNFLDKYIGMSMVLVAGYEKLMMDRFFPSNEGLPRRFPYRLVLKKYSTVELTDILIRFVEFRITVPIDEELGDWFFSVITKMSELGEDEIFPNQAGDMLNLGTSIVKAINSSYAVKWKDGDIENNTPILYNGLNDYLELKGFSTM